MFIVGDWPRKKMVQWLPCDFARAVPKVGVSEIFLRGPSFLIMISDKFLFLSSCVQALLLRRGVPCLWGEKGMY